MGEIMRRSFNWLDLELEGIYPVLSVALALLTYGLTTFLDGSGFLAVYLAGLVMQRKPFTHQQSILRFHDGLAWLMQVTMFLMLGLQVFPVRLVPIAWVGLLISLFLIFVARPASVHTALAFSPMPYREQTLVAWAGLRGAVPIILATFSVFGWGQTGRHDLPLGVLYCTHVRRHSGDGYSMAYTSVEDQSATIR